MPRIHLVPLALLACAVPAAAQPTSAVKPDTLREPKIACTPEAPRPGEAVSCTLRLPNRPTAPAPPRPQAHVIPRVPACHWHLPGRLPRHPGERSVHGGLPTADGRAIAIQTLQPDGPVVHLLAWANGRWRKSIPGPWAPSGSRGFAFSPDGSLLAEATGWGVVRVWALSEGMVPFTLLHPGAGADGEESPRTDVTSVSFSPDGRLLASTSLDGSVAVWDVHARRALWTRLPGAGEISPVAAFGRDGLLYVPGGVGVQVLSPANGAVLRTLWLPVGAAPHTRDSVPAMVNSFVLDLALSADGQVLAVSGNSVEGTSTATHASTPWLVVRTLAEPGPGAMIRPPEAVVGLRVSGDGQWVVGTSSVATAYVWEAGGREAYRIPSSAILAEGGAQIADAFFSPDGTLLYTIHNDSRPVVVWSLTGQAPPGVECHQPRRRRAR